jgi:hypothetical protein
MVSEQDAFEFYFRIADGKSTADMNVGTFRIETDKSNGSFLSEIFTEPEVLSTHYGLMVYEPDSTIHYYPAPGDVVLSLAYTNSDQLITPNVSLWPSSSPITYGDTLADSALVGGSADVPGTFDWIDDTTAPAVADSVENAGTTYGIRFTPTDTGTYLTVDSALALTVNPYEVAIPTVNADRTYNGLTQTPDITPSSYYTVTGSAINADTYTDAVVSLTDPANCEWTDHTTTDKTLSWTIAPADYTLNVPVKDIKVGSANSELPEAVTAGPNGETPGGTLIWYASEADRTAATPISVGYVAGLTLGDADADKDYTLYWTFQQIADDNYITTVKEGSTVITIINGDPQFVEITGEPGSVYYGASNFTLGSVVTTTGGAPAPGHGTVTWASSDTAVATIDPSTGEVDVLTAGSTTITATAAYVPGSYAAGSSSWELDVLQVPLTVTAGAFTVTKVYDSTIAPGTGSGALSVTGILAGDEAGVTVGAVPQAYTSKNVGGQATVAATLSLSGAKSGNYTLTTGTVDVPCSITQKPITAVSVTSVTKPYDATTGGGDWVVDGVPTLTGMVEGDDLSIDFLTASFSDANVATADKTASVTLGALTGTDAGNYNLTAASPITAAANIVPADITGYSTAAPSATILANNENNLYNAAKLKSDGITLPANVDVTYAAGTASLPIVWADAEEAYNIKGGTYTYEGTVTSGSNFNAYATTLDAVLTVTPVTMTGIATVPASLTVAKSTVEGATTHIDLGFPNYITLSYDNASPTVDSLPDWDTTLGELQTLAGTVDETTDQTATVTLTNANFPVWATYTGDLPSTVLTITNKIVIPESDIAFTDATITFGDVLMQMAEVNPATYSGTTSTYVYTGTGSTTYGPSATAPVNAGTYSVVATVQNDTHKGTKSATLTINRKTLDPAAIAVIPDQTYTGDALEPALTVTDGAIQLVVDTDYTAAYSSNTNAGTAGVIVTGVGNYTGIAAAPFTILPKNISGVTITAADETYNGGAFAPAYTVKDGDTTLVLNTHFTFTDYANNTNAGTADINIAGTGNYTGTATGHFTINKADYDMSAIGFADASKAYNGTAQRIEITGTLPTGADAKTVTVNYSGSATNVSDNPQTITATFATTSTNYNVPEAKTAILTIIPAEITVSGITADDKVYDGTTDATLNYSGMGLTGMIGGDDLDATATGAFEDKNVGANKQVDLSDLTLTGTDVGNYVLAASGQQTTTTADITAKTVVVSGITADDKEYDTTTAVVIDTGSADFDGKLPEDSLTVSTTGTFADANAGTGKTVNLGVLTLGGADSGNYALAVAGQQTTATADINAKPVTVSGITAANKTYDTTNTATVDTSGATFDGIFGGDTLTVSTTGTFANENAGTGKTVTFGTLILGGASAGNYSVKGDSQTTTTANISKETVTVSGIVAADKTYDGETDATIDPSGAIFAGKYAGDTLTVSTTGTFADANAGAGKTVTLGTLVLGGADVGNYQLGGANQTTTTATIHQREVIVSGIGALDMVYNGTTLTGTNLTNVSFANKLTGDTLTITATANFTDKNAGTDKTVNLTGLTLGGADAANYVLAATGNQSVTTADIFAKEVTVTGITAADKTYNGTTAATIDPSGAAFAGIVGGDTLTVSTTGTFANADAGVAKPVTFGTLVLGGADAGNYTVKNDSQTTTTATIHKANQAALVLNIDTAVLVGNVLTASATGGSGDGAITYSNAGGAGAGILAGNTFTATGAGTVNLTATKAASTNYNEVTSAPVTVTITDKTEVASRAIVKDDIADQAIKDHLVNEGKYTVGEATRKSVNVNEFTVAVRGTAPLTAYDSSDPAQGSGNWIGVILGGFKVNGGAAAGTTDLFYSADGVTYTQLAAADLTEAQSVGGVDGEFILWLKSEAVGAGVDRYIATDAAGANETKVTVTFAAYVPSSGGGTITPSPVTEPPVTTGTTTTGTTTVTPITTGTTSTVVVNNATLSTAVNNTVDAAEDTQTAASVVVSVPTPPETKKVEVTIPKAPVSTLADSDPAASLTVQTGVASVAFDGAALQTITEEARGASLTIVTVNVEKETLTTEQQDLVGDRPVLDLAVMSGNQIISDFKGGKATVTVPYTLREGETGEGITIWFMTDDGNLTEVECAYDAATGSVRFTTGHFSQYVLAHFPFTDMKDSEWYYENVVYAYTNGLMNGTQETTFSPESDITRGMVVTILWRMAGQPAAAKHSFKDVQFSWYDQAISWAFANNIVSGYGPDRFGPENLITREEMAKILRNYAIYAGRTVDQSAEIQGFGDAARVSGWAVESLKWAVGSGIIGGTNHNTLEPMGQATRAQVAAILQRFIQNEAE